MESQHCVPFLESVKETICLHSCFRATGWSHLLQTEQHCLKLFEDWMDSCHSHSPPCRTQSLQSGKWSVFRCGNVAEDGLKLSWKSKQMPQFMDPLQCITDDRWGCTSCLCYQINTVRTTVYEQCQWLCLCKIGLCRGQCSEDRLIPVQSQLCPVFHQWWWSIATVVVIWFQWLYLWQ